MTNARWLSSEVEKAKAAAAAKRKYYEPNIFSQILDGSIAADVIYQDDKVLNYVSYDIFEICKW